MPGFPTISRRSFCATAAAAALRGPAWLAAQSTHGSATHPDVAGLDHDRILRDAAESLGSSGQRPSRRDILDNLLHLMACKAAVKAGQRLKPEEMESLLAQRHLIDDAHHCPHGRPTALVLTRAELDRQFGRLG